MFVDLMMTFKSKEEVLHNFDVCNLTKTRFGVLLFMHSYKGCFKLKPLSQQVFIARKVCNKYCLTCKVGVSTQQEYHYLHVMYSVVHLLYHQEGRVGDVTTGDVSVACCGCPAFYTQLSDLDCRFITAVDLYNSAVRPSSLLLYLILVCFGKHVCCLSNIQTFQTL